MDAAAVSWLLLSFRSGSRRGRQQLLDHRANSCVNSVVLLYWLLLHTDYHQACRNKKENHVLAPSQNVRKISTKCSMFRTRRNLKEKYVKNIQGADEEGRSGFHVLNLGLLEFYLCLSAGFEPQVGRTFDFICKNKNKKGFNC